MDVALAGSAELAPFLDIMEPVKVNEQDLYNQMEVQQLMQTSHEGEYCLYPVKPIFT
jgi:hypothetical protein